MNRIGKREFYSNPSKYIKPGMFILTSHGKDELKVIVTNNQPIDTNNTPGNVPNNTNVTNNPKVTNKVTTLPDNASKEEKLKTARLIPNVKTPEEVWKGKEHRMAHYGCGCKKTDESLCGKHERR